MDNHAPAQLNYPLPQAIALSSVLGRDADVEESRACTSLPPYGEIIKKDPRLSKRCRRNAYLQTDVLIIRILSHDLNQSFPKSEVRRPAKDVSRFSPAALRNCRRIAKLPAHDSSRSLEQHSNLDTGVRTWTLLAF